MKTVAVEGDGRGGMSGLAAPSVVGGIAGEIFRELRAGGSLPDGIEPHEATTAALCTVLARLELEPARALLDALGEEARGAIGTCPIHGGELGERFDDGELLRRVASHFDLAPAAVRPMTAAVLSAVRRRLPDAIAALIDAELPCTIRALWRGAGAG